MSYLGPGRYRHFRGSEYEVLGLALQEDSIDKSQEYEPGVTYVIYKPLTPGSLLEKRQESFWARRLDDFNAIVDHHGAMVHRFRKVRTHQ